MVKNIVRVKNDFFNYALTWLIFKNKFFLLAIRLVILALFVAALIYGFLNPSPRTFHFNVGIFWSLFWPFFMVVSLGTFGALFCGVCPHGFVGKYLTRYGLKRTMPAWMQHPPHWTWFFSAVLLADALSFPRYSQVSLGSICFFRCFYGSGIAQFFSL